MDERKCLGKAAAVQSHWEILAAFAQAQPLRDSLLQLILALTQFGSKAPKNSHQEAVFSLALLIEE